MEGPIVFVFRLILGGIAFRFIKRKIEYQFVFPDSLANRSEVNASILARFLYLRKFVLALGCVNILSALSYRSDLRHSTPLEGSPLSLTSTPIDISRLWREEDPDLREVSLLQRSNISIERDSSVLLHSSGVLCPQTCPL